jgi:hypothetical protein
MGAHRPLLDQVFILRFWREDADASDHGHWRVMVRNINTRRRDVVDDVQRAFAIVAGSLNEVVTGENAQSIAADQPPGLPGGGSRPVEDAK